MKTITDLINYWNNFYERVFGMISVDFTGVQISDLQEGCRHTFMAEGLNYKKAIKAAERLFLSYYYHDDLDNKVITVNDRFPTSSYVVQFRDCIEADEHLKNLSASDLRWKRVKGITLLEYMVKFIEHHDRTGGYLDIDNITLCSGSRVGSLVPEASWSSGLGRFYMSYFEPLLSRPYLRTRELVLP